MKHLFVTWYLMAKTLFKKYGLPVNIMPVKCVEKAGTNKSQNKEEGATNNHATESNNWVSSLITVRFSLRISDSSFIQEIETTYIL